MLPGHIFKNYNHLKLGGAKGRDYFGSRSSCRLPEVANYILSTETTITKPMLIRKCDHTEGC